MQQPQISKAAGDQLAAARAVGPKLPQPKIPEILSAPGDTN